MRVIPALDPLEDRGGEVGPGRPAPAVEQSRCSVPKNDSIKALSAAEPRDPSSRAGPRRGGDGRTPTMCSGCRDPNAPRSDRPAAVAGDRLEDQRAVLDGLRERARVVERLREREDAPPADASGARLEADAAAERRGDADRIPRVRTERAQARAGRDRRAAPARRAAESRVRRNIEVGAGDGSRTRDLLLGRQMLYQLSYPRLSPILVAISADCLGGPSTGVTYSVIYSPARKPPTASAASRLWAS